MKPMESKWYNYLECYIVPMYSVSAGHIAVDNINIDSIW